MFLINYHRFFIEFVIKTKRRITVRGLCKVLMFTWIILATNFSANAMNIAPNIGDGKPLKYRFFGKKAMDGVRFLNCIKEAESELPADDYKLLSEFVNDCKVNGDTCLGFLIEKKSPLIIMAFRIVAHEKAEDNSFRSLTMNRFVVYKAEKILPTEVAITDVVFKKILSKAYSATINIINSDKL